MNIANNPWKRSLEYIVDQRNKTLPPVWVSSSAPAAKRIEKGKDVHQSGPGRAVANMVIALLGRAREKVVIASFLLADKAIEDAILETANRGIRVYVLLASEARLGREEGDSEFDKKTLEQHKTMLNRLGGHVLFRTAPHFHAKVVIVDPEKHPSGILLTANLTSEALERNEEIAVSLTPDEVIDITAFLKWAMWESAEHEFINTEDRFRAVNPLGKVPHPSSKSEIVVTTSKARTIKDKVLEIIDGAPSKIMISSFGWEADHAVIKRLCARARKGIDVTVLARVRPSSMPALLTLAEAGAKVFGYHWLHAKALWTDRNRALVMSANIQANGLDQGFEIGICLSEGREQEVLNHLEAWQNKAPFRLMTKPTLGEVTGKAQLWHQGHFEEITVGLSDKVDLGIIHAASAEDINAPRPHIPEDGILPRMAHEIRYSWTVAAPVVAKESKEIRRPVEEKQPSKAYTPPVYREPSGRLVVVIRHPEEINDAKTVKSEVGAEAIVVAAVVIRRKE